MAGWSVPGVVHLGVVREDLVGRRVLARHRMTRRSLSITYLSPEMLADAEFRARFEDECAALARVREARVARVHRYVACDHDAAVIGDHVPGTSLRSLLLAQGAVGTEVALVVLKDVLLALAACHEAGVAHGDVKPEDVILTPAGRVRLVDAGLWSATGRRELTRSTPFYLAPEQWSGPPATPVGDVYAATVSFFECVVGAPPFYGDDAAELAAKHGRIVPPVEVVPETLRELVVRGLAKDPSDRPKARNLVECVEDVAARTLAAGWERRGRGELVALLSGRAAALDMPAPGRRRGEGGWGGCRKPVRLAAVMGGALALAAGLSSPPLAVIPGLSIFGSGEHPPVLEFPEPDRGTAAVRVVTNRPLTERGTTPAAKAKGGGLLGGPQRPAASAPDLRVHTAPYEPELRGGRPLRSAEPQSASSSQSTPAPPACTQPLVDRHQPCIQTNPEQPTPTSPDTTSDSSEVSLPVSLPIPLPIELPAPVEVPVKPPTAIQFPVPITVPSSVLPPRSKDIRIPKNVQAQTGLQPSGSQLSGMTVRTRSSDADSSPEFPTSRSQKGSWSPMSAGNPGNR